MPNPVTDGLFSPTGDSSETWQNDAGVNAPSSVDQNRPQASDTMGAASPTGLASELRSMKSVVKGFALDPVWVNYNGDDVVAPSPLPAQYNSSVSFTLANGSGGADWTGIATIGRQVRATFADSTRKVATIKGTQVINAGTQTLVTLNDSILGTNTPQLSYVEFSSLNPDLNPFWLSFDPAQALSGDFVVPVSQGGTGQNSAAAGGDLSGAYPNPNVAKVGNSPVQVPLTAPTTGDVLSWSGALWDSASLATILALSQTTTSAGHFNVPTNTGTSVIVSWGVITVSAFGSPTTTVALSFTPVFTTQCFVVIPSINQVSGGSSPRFTLETQAVGVGGADVLLRLISGSAPTSLEVFYIAIGV